MASFVKPFLEYLTEEEHPDFPGMERSEIEELEEIGALSIKPIKVKFHEFKKNFEKDPDITAAITALSEAGERYFEKVFSERERNDRELHNLLGQAQNEADDIEDKSPLSKYNWFDWWITH